MDASCFEDEAQQELACIMEHFVYKTTCSATGKFYVGMHSGSTSDAYLGSGLVLRNSIKKHGRKQHTREVLEMCVDRKQLSKREAELVNIAMRDPLCMNLIPGGIGGTGKFHTEDAKAKCRAAAARREASHYVRGEQHGMYGRTHTSEVRANISVAAKKPKQPFSEEHRRKLSEHMKRVNADRRAARMTA